VSRKSPPLNVSAGPWGDGHFATAFVIDADQALVCAGNGVLIILYLLYLTPF